MDGTSLLLWGTLFGGIGIGFFIYGNRRQAAVLPLTGIARFISPYFIQIAYVPPIVGAIVVTPPYFVRL